MATILIVDDNPINRRSLAAILAESGHHLRQARNGAEALESVAEQRPDAIVSDLLMPVMDGYRMLSVLRGNPATRAIPVVVSTAHYGARALALKSGATWFLTNAESARLNSIVQRVLSGETEALEDGPAGRNTAPPAAAGTGGASNQ